MPPAFDVWFDVACAPDWHKRFSSASVAWKQLTVALDTPGRDTSGSFPGRDLYEHSGERRVVVVPGEESTEPTAPTLESKPLLSRTHDDEFKSLQRIPLRSVAPPETDADARAAAGASASSAPRRDTRGIWLAATVVAGAVGAGVVAWRALAPEPSAPAAAANAATAVTAAATVPAVPAVVALPPKTTAGAPQSPATTTAAAPLEPPAPSASHGPARPPARTASALSASAAGQAPASMPAAATAAAVPPPAATTNDERHATPPPSATTTGAVDPGSYR